jgi:RNA-splicing ligase RtcB
MSLGITVIFLNHAARYTLAALDRQRDYLAAVGFGIAVNASLCVVLVPRLGFPGACLAFLGAEVTIWLIQLRALSPFVSATDVARDALRPLAAAGLAALWMLGLDAHLAVRDHRRGGGDLRARPVVDARPHRGRAARAAPRLPLVPRAARQRHPPRPEDGAMRLDRTDLAHAAPAKLTMLSGAPNAGLRSRLETLADLPWVDAVLALPDVHQKDKAEIPSSVAVTTLDAIVPEFTSVAVNDGMGVVLTDLEAKDFTPERVLAFFRRVNEDAARHILDRNRFSLDGGADAARRARRRARGCGFYGHPAEFADRMEWSGRVRVPGGGDPWRDLVPTLLKATALGRREMGLNFGGNHFLELQAVDRTDDPALARDWGLRPNRVAVMYHLGPGPFGSILLHHFSRRKSLKGHARRSTSCRSSSITTAAARGRARSRRRWDLHFRQNGWTRVPRGIRGGLRLRQAIALATNFGFVYRLATIAAIRDALDAVFGRAIGIELLCDIAHNSVVEEPWGEGTAWVARHNACRLAPRAPAIVAGDHDVPSVLGVGAVDAVPGLHSYDHGAGSIIDSWRSAGACNRPTARPSACA